MKLTTKTKVNHLGNSLNCLYLNIITTVTHNSHCCILTYKTNKNKHSQTITEVHKTDQSTCKMSEK